MSTTQTQRLKILLQNPQIITTKLKAKQVHAQVIKHKGFSSTFSTTVLCQYSNLNLLHDSVSIFKTLHSPSVLAWKSLIKCYASNGFFVDSLACFARMLALGKYPDHNVFPSVLKSCGFLMDLRLGECVHGFVVRLGVDSDLYTNNALMNMYAKFQSLAGNSGFETMAYQVFDKIPKPIAYCRMSFSDTSTSGCMGNDTVGRYKLADGIGLNDVSVSRECGGENLEDGLDWNKIMRATSPLDNMRKVFETMPFRDLVSWNTAIVGNVQNGLYEEALVMVRNMGETGLKPDSFTLSSVLPIFAELVDVDKGKEIHAYAIRHGFDTDLFIGSSLIDMYAKCTRVDDSCQVFNLLPRHDGISWNSMIASCVQNGEFDEGLKYFRLMLKDKVRPGPVSFSSIMPACAHLTSLNMGKQIHGYIIRAEMFDNVYIASSLVDMYAKCGKIEMARWVFNKMELHDTVSWTAIIMGCALHGQALNAVSLFEQMESDGVKPNYVSYIAVLTACSHAGLVDEGWKHYTRMTKEFGIAPGIEHYAAMVDLLGRAGRLEAAYDLISSMPSQPTGTLWFALLAACRVHKNDELGERVAEKLLTIDPQNVGAYILMSNIYSSAKRYKEAARLRVYVRDRGFKKTPACSWIEVRNKVHAFVAGDASHPDHKKIQAALQVLSDRMEREGYKPDTSEVLQDVDDDQKKHLLQNHSERLAIAFGIISTSPGTTIRIIKNIRVCSDCHAAIKIISGIVGREIVVRDNSRFHHFKDGKCSCGDYW